MKVCPFSARPTSGTAWGWKHHALGLFFCKRTRTTDLCKGKNEWGHESWDFDFHQQGHWRWNVAGSFSMTMIPNTPPGQRRSGFVRSISRSWSGLASLQISDLCHCQQRVYNKVLRWNFVIDQILIFHHNLQINSLKILQCDFLDFFFLFCLS